MATFHFDLVSPEKLLFSSEVSQDDIPGTEGDFGVLAGHAPIVTTVRPGVLVIHGEAGEEFDRSVLAGMIKDTEEDVADTADPWERDKLARRLEQLRALQGALGS